jgi:hypothetical protein
VPLGSGATYSGSSDARTSYLSQCACYINSGEWSYPVYQASTSDPLRTVFASEDTSKTLKINVPSGAVPDPTTDSWMLIIDPTKKFVTSMFPVSFRSNGDIQCERAWQDNLNGDGRIAQVELTENNPSCRGTGSAFGGLLRQWELQGTDDIRHALSWATGPAGLKHSDPVPWPGVREDYDGFQVYHGTMVMGTLIAIQPTVDITTLGLNANALRVAKALQNFGAYLSDQSEDFNITLYAEKSAEGSTALNQVRADIGKIIPYLRVVTNNTAPSNPVGGGTPRAPTAPALA